MCLGFLAIHKLVWPRCSTTTITANSKNKYLCIATLCDDLGKLYFTANIKLLKLIFKKKFYNVLNILQSHWKFLSSHSLKIVALNFFLSLYPQESKKLAVRVNIIDVNFELKCLHTITNTTSWAVLLHGRLIIRKLDGVGLHRLAPPLCPIFFT